MLVFALVLATVCPQVTAVSRVSFDNHDIRLTLDIAPHSADVTDSGLMAVTPGWNLFELAQTAQIEGLQLGGVAAEFRTVQMADVGQLEPELRDNLPEIDTSAQVQLVLFEQVKEGTVSFLLVYQAEFFQDVEGIRFSNEMVGGEVLGTILEKGAYLSSSSCFYPQGDESLTRFKLTADVPDSWESVSDGNRLSSETSNGRKVQTWENPFKSDGCMFMAAPYVVRSSWVDSVEVACYFFEADTGLVEGYLEATTNYIRMYSDLIGPYPYDRFTVAENFFPTGYGMPAWTLLGQQVLRLPFIKSTSLGHEVLHNWWGNSVYVDYDRGNWCEAITVYGADYRYKLMQSEQSAEAYRKNILKQYVSYINEGNDFPIREFRSRTSPGTRTIGYNKAMMVYHMIEQEIGTEPFFATWKQVYADHREKQISWEEWISGFEKASGSDLSHIIPQWIDRSGAPVLDIEVIKVDETGGEDGRLLKFKLMEKSGQNYRLKVPLRFSGTETVVDTSVILESEEMLFTMPWPDGAKSIEADPNFHLFRQLYPEEIEPVVSAILGNEDKRFVIGEPAGLVDTFRLFAENLTGDTASMFNPDQFTRADSNYAAILLNPSDLPMDLRERVTIGTDSITIDGSTYPVAGHTFVLAADSWRRSDKCLVILSGDGSSLPRIGQLVPHYGKYSYLVFSGSRNVGKGQWEVTSSPLKKSLI
jgi:hypothetical protein